VICADTLFLAGWPVLSDGSSAFDQSQVRALDVAVPPGGLQDTLLNFDCEGNALLRVSDGILLAISVPNARPIFSRLAQTSRDLVLDFADSNGQCITDDQIASFFVPWSPAFALTALTKWGPGLQAPDLLPTMSSLQQKFMEHWFAESTTGAGMRLEADGTCLGLCGHGGAGDDGPCGPGSNSWNCCHDDPGAEHSSTFVYTDDGHQACVCSDEACTERPRIDLGFSGYPRFVVPPTCSAAGYLAGHGCAMSYDFANMLDHPIDLS